MNNVTETGDLISLKNFVKLNIPFFIIDIYIVHALTSATKAQIKVLSLEYK